MNPPIPEIEGGFEALPPSSGVVGEIDSISERAGAGEDLRKSRRRKASANNGISDRLPPHAMEAEQGVLGCILLSPNDCLATVITNFPATDEVFYDLRHQTIYANLVSMYEMRQAIDIITIQQRLKDFDMLDAIGGIPYLNALQDAVPSAANLSYYLEIVLEKFVLRKAVSTCTEVVQKIYSFEGDSEQLLDEMERDILAIRSGGRKQLTAVGMKQSVAEAMEDIEALTSSGGKATGLRTGFLDLDRMTGGFNGGEMIVIAARPSLGKTSLAMNIADFVSVETKLPVGVFSLEMTRRALTTRMICSRARVNLRNLSEGYAADADYPKLTNAGGRISQSGMLIDDTPGLSIMQLRARARMMWQMSGIKLFVIDYLQLLSSTTKRGKENRQQEVSEISSGIKALAKELNVPVIVLSQLNREIDRSKRKPQLSDLRESGSIEQDADFVGFLYNVKIDGDEDYEAIDALPVNLKIAKQRNGPIGEVNLTFLKPYTRFESASKVDVDDIPPSQNNQPEL